MEHNRMGSETLLMSKLIKVGISVGQQVAKKWVLVNADNFSKENFEEELKQFIVDNYLQIEWRNYENRTDRNE